MPPQAKHEAIWWKGVDISRVANQSFDAVPGPPRRKPDWGTVSQFFTCAEEVAGVNLESHTSSADPHSIHGNNGRGPNRSPTKRGGKRESRMGAFQKSKANNGRQRPCSAPALLRNEGFIAREPSHKDAMRQQVEDIAVRGTLGWMHREGQRKKDVIDRVDVLADSILFDLKVLHNSAQRAKGSKLRPASSSPAGRQGVAVQRQKSAVDSLRDLVNELAKDTKLDSESTSNLQMGLEDTGGHKLSGTRTFAAPG